MDLEAARHPRLRSLIDIESLLMNLSPDAIANLGGTVLAITVLIAMLRYFMKSLEGKDGQIVQIMNDQAKIIQHNTEVIANNTSALAALQSSIERGQP